MEKTNDHLDSETIAAYAERRITSDEMRLAVKQHLVECEQCRELWTEVVEYLGETEE